MTLREFIEANGGWTKIRNDLVIRTSDSYIICSACTYESWSIQELLDNKMYLPVRREEHKIYIYVQD